MTRRASIDAQRVGASLEDLLTFTHILYWNRHHVWVDHNGIAGEFHMRKGRRVFHPVSRQAAPDYYGCVDGIFIAFDAKTTKNKTRWRLHKDYAHQFTRLKDIHQAGGVSFFAIEQRVTHTMWLLKVHNRMEWPKLSFDPQESELIPRIPLNDEGLYDWLPEARSWVALARQRG